VSQLAHIAGGFFGGVFGFLFARREPGPKKDADAVSLPTETPETKE
jgi:hypothetical protein